MNNWIARIAAQKVMKRLAQLSIAWLMGQNLDRFGVTINGDLLTGAFYGAMEFGRNYLKQKTGLRWL